MRRATLLLRTGARHRVLWQVRDGIVSVCGDGTEVRFPNPPGDDVTVRSLLEVWVKEHYGREYNANLLAGIVIGEWRFCPKH